MAMRMRVTSLMALEMIRKEALDSSRISLGNDLMRLSKHCADTEGDEAEFCGAAAVLEIRPGHASDEFQNEMVGEVPPQSAADVPGKVRLAVSAPVAGVVGAVVAAESSA